MFIQLKSELQIDGRTLAEGEVLELPENQARPIIEVGTAVEVEPTAETKKAIKQAKAQAPTPASNPEKPTEDWKRPRLDAFAKKAGVENPEALPNKRAVLDAIETAQTPKEELKNQAGDTVTGDEEVAGNSPDSEGGDEDTTDDEDADKTE
jgi:hypothetical protein